MADLVHEQPHLWAGVDYESMLFVCLSLRLNECIARINTVVSVEKSNQDDKMWLQPFTDVSNQNDLSVECNTCVYAVSLFVSPEAGSHSQFPPSSPKREGRTSPFLNENIDAWNNELCWPDQLHLNPTLTSTAFSLTCFWDYRYVAHKLEFFISQTPASVWQSSSYHEHSSHHIKFTNEMDYLPSVSCEPSYHSLWSSIYSEYILANPRIWLKHLRCKDTRETCLLLLSWPCVLLSTIISTVYTFISPPRNVSIIYWKHTFLWVQYAQIIVQFFFPTIPRLFGQTAEEKQDSVCVRLCATLLAKEVLYVYCIYTRDIQH